MKHLAALILLTALVVLSILVLQEHKPELPIVQTAYPSQPAWRLFTTCPVERRNVPRLEERTT